MASYLIQLTLSSDATFSRGDGVAGVLDREVEHDEWGLPYLHGRTLKGLLGEEADNLLDCMMAMGIVIENSDWEKAHNTLFGKGGSKAGTGAALHYGPAQLPAALRETVQLTMRAEDNRLSRQDVLASLTAVRRQTAVNGDGLPHDGSLRSMRVILRQMVFTAELNGRDLQPTELALLAAAVLALRRAGTGRNRGRGQLQADLLDENGNSILQSHYQVFADALSQEVTL